MKGEPNLLRCPKLKDGGKGWVVVDDLVDTGSTMQIVKSLFPQSIIVVLYAKPKSVHLADLFVREYAQDVWLKFPWE